MQCGQFAKGGEEGFFCQEESPSSISGNCLAIGSRGLFHKTLYKLTSVPFSMTNINVSLTLKVLKDDQVKCYLATCFCKIKI